MGAFYKYHVQIIPSESGGATVNRDPRAHMIQYFSSKPTLQHVRQWIDKMVLPDPTDMSCAICLTDYDDIDGGLRPCDNCYSTLCPQCSGEMTKPPHSFGLELRGRYFIDFKCPVCRENFRTSR